MGSDLTKTNWPFVEKNSKHCCGLASSMLGQKLQTYSPIWWAMMVMFIPWYFLLEKHHQKTHPNGWCMQIPEFWFYGSKKGSHRYKTRVVPLLSLFVSSHPLQNHLLVHPHRTNLTKRLPRSVLVDVKIAPVEVGSFSHYLQGFSTIQTVVGLGISEPSTVGSKEDWGLFFLDTPGYESHRRPSGSVVSLVVFWETSSWFCLFDGWEKLQTYSPTWFDSDFHPMGSQSVTKKSTQQ